MVSKATVLRPAFAYQVSIKGSECLKSDGCEGPHVVAVMTETDLRPRLCTHRFGKPWRVSNERLSG